MPQSSCPQVHIYSIWALLMISYVKDIKSVKLAPPRSNIVYMRVKLIKMPIFMTFSPKMAQSLATLDVVSIVPYLGFLEVWEYFSTQFSSTLLLYFYLIIKPIQSIHQRSSDEEQDKYHKITFPAEVYDGLRCMNNWWNIQCVSKPQIISLNHWISHTQDKYSYGVKGIAIILFCAIQIL